MKYGGIEFGGTKIICAIADDYGIIDRLMIPTTVVEDCLRISLDYFEEKGISSLGIGSFGPVDLDKSSGTYGYITTTPKTGWNNTNLVGFFKQLNIPIGFDTDVNAACLGEIKYGAGKGFENVIYGTIGTGIGFGVYLNSKLVHGLMHPETGHMILKKHDCDEGFVGPCPYHDSCLETLASGLSIEKRWHKKASDLYNKKEVWKLEAYYIGQALCNCVMCYSPEIIILGGGVMHKPGLVELIRKEVLKNLNGYIKKKEILENIDNYIVLPGLLDDSGIVGSIELGKMELKK